jgi:hypothetical protein
MYLNIFLTFNILYVTCSILNLELKNQKNFLKNTTAIQESLCCL